MVVVVVAAAEEADGGEVHMGRCGRKSRLCEWSAVPSWCGRKSCSVFVIVVGFWLLLVVVGDSSAFFFNFIF